MSYEIKLPIFEGPFDLLLFFIERDELDIYDIPIAQITDDFLGYIQELEQLNMEVASDFILMASTLMRIKAKMLIPRPEVNEDGEEVDPRQELAQRLVDYKVSKELAKNLSKYETEMLNRDERGYAMDETREIAKNIGLDVELEEVDLYRLMRTFQQMMTDYETRTNTELNSIKPYAFTVSKQKTYLLQRIRTESRINFGELMRSRPDKIFVVFNFLAVLDLIQNEKIGIEISEGYNNFFLVAR
ncbi:MAG: segregation/condensation protein A [Bacteroidota bacterium]